MGIINFSFTLKGFFIIFPSKSISPSPNFSIKLLSTVSTSCAIKPYRVFFSLSQKPSIQLKETGRNCFIEVNAFSIVSTVFAVCTAFVVLLHLREVGVPSRVILHWGVCGVEVQDWRNEGSRKKSRSRARVA